MATLQSDAEQDSSQMPEWVLSSLGILRWRELSLWLLHKKVDYLRTWLKYPTQGIFSPALSPVQHEQLQFNSLEQVHRQPH